MEDGRQVKCRLWTSSLQRTILTAAHIPHPLVHYSEFEEEAEREHPGEPPPPSGGWGTPRNSAGSGSPISPRTSAVFASEKAGTGGLADACATMLLRDRAPSSRPTAPQAASASASADAAPADAASAAGRPSAEGRSQSSDDPPERKALLRVNTNEYFHVSDDGRMSNDMLWEQAPQHLSTSNHARAQPSSYMSITWSRSLRRIHQVSS